MKKLISTLLLSGILFVSSSLFAINKNQSIEYVRTLNRNASTDIDATFYNPAGLVFMKHEGLSIQVANQIIIQEKSVKEDSTLINTYVGNEQEYKGEVNAYLFPDLHIAYKKEKMVFFFNFMPIAGGGSGEFKNGLPLFDNLLLGAPIKAAGTLSQLDPTSPVTYQVAPGSYSRELAFTGTQYTLASTIGGAYKVNKKFSVAAGYRLQYARAEYSGYAKDLSWQALATGTISDIQNAALVAQGLNTTGTSFAGLPFETIMTGLTQKVELDTVATGWGHSIVAGAHIRPIDKLDIGFRVDWNSPLKIKYDTSTMKGHPLYTSQLEKDYGDGVTTYVTEPWLFALGVSYNITKELRVEVNTTAELYEYVNYTDEYEEDNRQNAWFTGIAIEYAVLPELKLSVGYAYDTNDRKDKARSEIDYGLPVHHIAAGGGYDIDKKFSIGIGYIHSFYQGQNAQGEAREGTEGYDQRVNKTSMNFAIGVNMKL